MLATESLILLVNVSIFLFILGLMAAQDLKHRVVDGRLIHYLGGLASVWFTIAVFERPISTFIVVIISAAITWALFRRCGSADIKIVFTTAIFLGAFDPLVSFVYLAFAGACSIITLGIIKYKKIPNQTYPFIPMLVCAFAFACIVWLPVGYTLYVLFTVSSMVLCDMIFQKT